MKKFTLCMFILLAGCFAAGSRDPSVPIQAVSEFEPSRYLGRWFEIGRFPVWFEEGCTNTTAEYSLIATIDEAGEPLPSDPIEIQVTNTCYQGSKDGEKQVATGRARYEDTGRFNVTFAPFYIGSEPNYWVLAQRDYEIAVIGNPSGKTGWILARHHVVSEDMYEWGLRVLEANGYDVTNFEPVVQDMWAVRPR